MTIQIPWRGIIEIVGDHDVGKTIAMLQTTNQTKDIVFVDDDIKGDGTVRQMKEAGVDLDMYIDLAQLRMKLGQTPTADELLQYVVMPTIEKITEKHHKIIIWDTWRIVYQSARGHVERNQHKYKDVANFSRGTSAMIQGLISKVARMIEVKILNELKASCDLLIISHHIKDNYVSNIVVGKIPESSNTFNEVCNMRMWLRRNPKSKVPIILFLKRPNVPKLSKGKLIFENIVPLKITPTDKHNSIWGAIAEYEAKPIESRVPTADETPTQEELSAISGTLTAEQNNYVKLMIEYQKTLESDLIETVSASHGTLQEALGAVNIDKSDTSTAEPVNGLQLLARAKSELDLSINDIQNIIGKSFAEINEGFDDKYWKQLLKNHDETITKMIAPAKKKK